MMMMIISEIVQMGVNVTYVTYNVIYKSRLTVLAVTTLF